MVASTYSLRRGRPPTFLFWNSLSTYLHTHLSRRKWPPYLFRRRWPHLPIYLGRDGHLSTYVGKDGHLFILFTNLLTYLFRGRWPPTYLFRRRWPPLPTYLEGDGHLLPFHVGRDGNISTYFGAANLLVYLPTYPLFI